MGIISLAFEYIFTGHIYVWENILGEECHEANDMFQFSSCLARLDIVPYEYLQTICAGNIPTEVRSAPEIFWLQIFQGIPSKIQEVGKTAGVEEVGRGIGTMLQEVEVLRLILRPCWHAISHREKVNIPPLKGFITIEGAGADKTIVQWGDTAKTIGATGQPIGTFNSATFAVNSAYFIAKNITFKNTTPLPVKGASGKQAVAFRISGDTAAFLGCRFLGAQDTLYDHLGRHYYKDCYIEGSVDFIFGNGLSLFEGCHVHAIAHNVGALTAQGRASLLDDTGFSFVNCKVTGSGALYLGRAWGTFSRVIFAYTYMDNIIISKGWYNWGDPNREMTVFYGQYKCTGPGANYAGRVSWARELTDEEAKPFISLSFIDGSEWIKF
ncbi:hypothetical protein GIB67_027892 [Kingdonia uniflora]|uniref:Pectinesterase n=1 Tax=Kingdonia uniflora TaxID=39325 RepID=A0A7J7LGT2_9MAGN|nr:hypothetical protein GIB67_027892 [Kingdonia uniflora]